MNLSLLAPATALQPSTLNDVTRSAMQDLLREGESQNTLASYRAALRYWAAWYGLSTVAKSSCHCPWRACCNLWWTTPSA